MKVKVTVTLDDFVLEALDEKAEEENRSRSNMLNQLLREMFSIQFVR